MQFQQICVIKPSSHHFCLRHIATRSACKRMVQCKNRKNSIHALHHIATRIQIILYALTVAMRRKQK